MENIQTILSFIPGYMWNGRDVVSTGAAIDPSLVEYQGEPSYYVRPIFINGPVGIYVSRKGILKFLSENFNKS